MKCVTKSKPVSVRFNKAHLDTAKRELNTESAQVVIDYLLLEFFNKIRKKGLEQMLEILMLSAGRDENEIADIKKQIEDLSQQTK